MRELRKLGVDDVVVAGDAHGKGNLRIEQLGDLEGLDLTLTRVHAPRALKTSFGMIPTLFRKIRRADVVHIHGFYLFHTAVAALLAKGFGKPYLIQPHGVFEPYQEAQSQKRKALYNRIVGKYVLQQAAGLIFATRSEKEHAEGLLEKFRLNSWLMPLGSTVSGAGQENETAERNFRNSNNVLFLARIAPKKRVDLVVSAVPLVRAEHPNVRLTIAGTGDMSLVTDALDRLSPQDQACITLAGFVQGEEKTAAFSEADVYVLPSENENFGISVAEALAHGLPVVITPDVAIADQVHEWNAGIVVPQRNVEDVASGILAALAPANRATMSQNAVQLADTHFSWEASARRAIDVYRAAIANPIPDRSSVGSLNCIGCAKNE